MRVAINGMGRIGRLLFKLLSQRKEIQIVAVNDLMTSENLHYLLKYDSISGAYDQPVTLVKDTLQILDSSIQLLHVEDPGQLPWRPLDIDLVVECTGRFTTYSLLEEHLKAGAKKVLLSTTGEEKIPLLIRGLNDKVLEAQPSILCSGGCMTNCSASILFPLLKGHEIESVHINVLHAYTSRQSLVDGANKNFRRGRASGSSIIPVEIDLAETLERLFPTITGKITATSTRVPVLCGALADFSVVLKDELAVEGVDRLYETTSKGELRNILACTSDPIVSADIIGNSHSAVYDATLTKVIHNHVKIGAWFDNEFGYTNRLVEIVGML
jgi:glyceraldehyde 3-phosphate dehydrogenase